MSIQRSYFLSFAVPSLSRPAWISPRVMKTEALAGLVVAIALIPEAISFSVLAGVDPRVGLFASFTMAVTIAFTGGRPARSEEHTSELQSLRRISYAVFCLK